jgi:hypothetical protein
MKLAGVVSRPIREGQEIVVKDRGEIQRSLIGQAGAEISWGSEKDEGTSSCANFARPSCADADWIEDCVFTFLAFRRSDGAGFPWPFVRHVVPAVWHEVFHVCNASRPSGHRPYDRVEEVTVQTGKHLIKSKYQINGIPAVRT